jgi:hypothetical protein
MYPTAHVKHRFNADVFLAYPKSTRTNLAQRSMQRIRSDWSHEPAETVHQNTSGNIGNLFFEQFLETGYVICAIRANSLICNLSFNASSRMFVTESRKAAKSSKWVRFPHCPLII